MPTETIYQGSGLPSLKKPPVGRLLGSVAAQTIPDDAPVTIATFYVMTQE